MFSIWDAKSSPEMGVLEILCHSSNIQWCSSHGGASGKTCQRTSAIRQISARSFATTNAIESVHRQFRKLTKTKGAFPNENSLLKLLYLGLINAQEKWTMPIQSWNLTLSQLAIYFDGRLNKMMTL
ncbi:Transposase and inactivated derivatives [Leminorella grimontii]|nr:Transposase and inactivated derivatives [Leminorella grimontii]